MGCGGTGRGETGRGWTGAGAWEGIGQVGIAVDWRRAFSAHFQQVMFSPILAGDVTWMEGGEGCVKDEASRLGCLAVRLSGCLVVFLYLTYMLLYPSLSIVSRYFPSFTCTIYFCLSPVCLSVCICLYISMS